MEVLITGTSKGIGLATALKFLEEGHIVWGLDCRSSAIQHENYTHFLCDVSKPETLPNLENMNIVINNAGTQEDADAIDVNLMGVINVTKKYAFQRDIQAVVNVASTSAHNGAEFPLYSASKGGVLAYTKHSALQIAGYGATCNSISPGGVITDMNEHILNNPRLWAQVMDEALIKKWATAEEIAEWIYFVAVVNRSMTAQDIIIDNGELANAHFVW